MTAAAPRRPMTEAERRMAQALGHCRFVPGTFDKRWCQGICWEATDGLGTITEKEAVVLREKVQRYRRQIPSEVVALADEPIPGGFEAPSLPTSQMEIL